MLLVLLTLNKNVPTANTFVMKEICKNIFRAERFEEIVNLTILHVT